MRSLDGVDLLNLKVLLLTESTVTTEYFIFGSLNDGCKWQVVEHSSNCVVAGLGVIGQFLQFDATLIFKPIHGRDLLIFVVASNHVDSVGVLDFECHEKANYFQRVRASVYEVTQEQVVELLYVRLVPLFGRHAPLPKIAHHVLELTMNVTKHLHRPFQF